MGGIILLITCLPFLTFQHRGIVIFVVSKVLADTPGNQKQCCFWSTYTNPLPLQLTPRISFHPAFLHPCQKLVLFLTLGFNTRCCSVRAFPFYIPRALHQLSHLLCSPRGDFTITCHQHNLCPDVQKKFHCQSYCYRRWIECCEVGTSPGS